MEHGSRQYRNPPIAEAICEIRFMPSVEWDLTVPGRLYEQIRGDYSGKPANQAAVEAEMAGPEGGALTTMRLKHGITRVRFPTADGTRSIVVGPNVLSVHVHRPYGGWEDLRERIARALEAYRRLNEPEAIQRVGLRYINQVVIPLPEVDLDEYFKGAPRHVEGLPLKAGAFFSRLELSYDDRTKLLITFARMDAPQGKSGFLLDLDVIWDARDIPVAEALPRVDDLRLKERVAFEAPHH